MTGTPLLAVEGLTVSYGPLVALRDVSIRVDQGEVVCIVGPNGAGKSTLLRAVAGDVAPRSGRISLSGEPITGHRPETIARRGLSLVPEGRHVFFDLTVDENLLVGTYMVPDRKHVARGIAEVMDYFPRLRERRASLAGRLSGGEQQMLVIARAILTGAKLIMVDEPSLGLAPRIVAQVYDVLLQLRRERGITLLINEQNSGRVLRYADRVYVLRGGAIRMEGTADALRDGTALKAAYFGFDHSHPEDEERTLA